jgi:hypothetical protein
MTLADTWSKDLARTHREALHTALNVLVDRFFDELPEMTTGEIDLAESSLASFLPPNYAPRYTLLFQKRFFACLLSVGWKLAQRRPRMPLLSCTAEELALRALIEQAKSVLEMRGVNPDFDDFEDIAFQDLDHEILFDPSLDGLEDTAAGVQLGMGYLHFDDWFKPFDNAITAVHPCAADEDVSG